MAWQRRAVGGSVMSLGRLESELPMKVKKVREDAKNALAMAQLVKKTLPLPRKPFKTVLK